MRIAGSAIGCVIGDVSLGTVLFDTLTSKVACRHRVQYMYSLSLKRVILLTPKARFRFFRVISFFAKTIFCIFFLIH